MKYFAKIRYVGTAYHGFQVQPNKRTVQGELCRAFFELFGKKTLVTGCSRTDARVHANTFCITAECEGATVPPERLPLAILPFLPPDLSLFEAYACPEDFHVRYDVLSKEYLYLINNKGLPDPFMAERALTLARPLSDGEIDKMKAACAAFFGAHDFSAFMSEGSKVVDTVRTVKFLTVEEKEGLIEIRICADGFLYNMVRIIVGTLLEVAYGRISADELPRIISSANRSLAGPTAQPEGLYLDKVTYPNSVFEGKGR